VCKEPSSPMLVIKCWNSNGKYAPPRTCMLLAHCMVREWITGGLRKRTNSMFHLTNNQWLALHWWRIERYCSLMIERMGPNLLCKIHWCWNIPFIKTSSYPHTTPVVVWRDYRIHRSTFCQFKSSWECLWIFIFVRHTSSTRINVLLRCTQIYCVTIRDT
jgi:hypothetical protein